MGVDAMIEALDMVKAGSAPRINQNLDEGSYESWFGKPQAEIDWRLPSDQIYNTIRASNPQPGAWTTNSGVKVQIFNSKLVESAGGKAGTVLRLDDEGLIIATGDDTNIDLTINPKGSGTVNIDSNVEISDGLIELKTGTGSVAKIKFYCESGNAHNQTLQAAPHSAASSAVLTLPTTTGTLIGTGDTGTLPLAAINIDGGTDIGAALTTSDLIVVDDGAGGTNRKAALSRMVTLMAANLDDPTALAIALG
jgi:hypothetical protein